MAKPTLQSQVRGVLASELPDVTDSTLTRIVARLEPVVSGHVLDRTLPLSQQLVTARAEAGREASLATALVDEAVDRLSA